MYSHRPASGLERGPDPSIPDFYREDELKYHGKVNRGVDTIDFMGELHLERSFQNTFFWSSRVLGCHVYHPFRDP